MPPPPLRSLSSLKRLSLQSNRLASMAGVGALTSLEELYLSHNGIERLEVGGKVTRGIVHLPACTVQGVAQQRASGRVGARQVALLPVPLVSMGCRVLGRW